MIDLKVTERAINRLCLIIDFGLNIYKIKETELIKITVLTPSRVGT